MIYSLNNKLFKIISWWSIVLYYIYRNSSVADVCNKSFLVVNELDSIEDALVLLNQKKCTSLVVERGNKYINFFTKEDIYDAIFHPINQPTFV